MTINAFVFLATMARVVKQILMNVAYTLPAGMVLHARYIICVNQHIPILHVQLLKGVVF